MCMVNGIPNRTIVLPGTRGEYSQKRETITGMVPVPVPNSILISQYKPLSLNPL